MASSAAQLGIFFDGTGNNKDIDIPLGRETNIAKLFRLYATTPYMYLNKADISFVRKKYIRGVGSVAGSRVIGRITGIGARRRIFSAYDYVKYQLDKSEAMNCDFKYIDIFGFSRGAAIARHFANMLLHLPMPVRDSTTATHELEIRFLGIFDTVASFGLPGNNIDLNIDLNVNRNKVSHCVHFTAAHERRSLFDLQSIMTYQDEQLPKGFIEKEYPGAHSDVGGGYAMVPYRASGRYKERIINGRVVDIPADNDQYEDLEYLTDDALYAQQEEADEDYYLPERKEKSNELSRIPLHDMHDAITKTGISMLSPDTDPRHSTSINISNNVQNFYDSYRKTGLSFDDAIQSKYIHDSRFPTDKLSEKIFNDNTREVYYCKPANVDWQNEKELMTDDWDNYDEDNV